MNKIKLRCQNCQTINQVEYQKLNLGPICGNCKTRLTYPNQPLTISSSLFNQLILQDPGIVLLDFWSPQCGYCMRLNPVLDELAKEQQGLLKIYKINVQSDNQLAAQFQVQGIPALFLFQNGVKISSKNGFLPKKQLLDWIMANIPLD